MGGLTVLLLTLKGWGWESGVVAVYTQLQTGPLKVLLLLLLLPPCGAW